MSYGKSIRIYLKEGSVSGLKFGEVVNQTIKAISCPRSRATELNQYPESRRPGVYFLFGEDGESGKPLVYIGESENVYDRIPNHLTNKDFWSEVVFFVSKDENLTKGHVKYLEHRLLQLAKAAGRYEVQNGNQSNASTLPRPDKDAMEEFISYLRLLLGIMGHKVLEEIAPHSSSSGPESGGLAIPFSISLGGVKAKALHTDEGMVVLQGSQASLNLANGLSTRIRKLREQLIQEGTLILSEGYYTFQKERLFSSPSTAAAVVVGYSINGREAWVDERGRTLNDLDKEQAQVLNDQLSN